MPLLCQFIVEDSSIKYNFKVTMSTHNEVFKELGKDTGSHELINTYL